MTTYLVFSGEAARHCAGMDRGREGMRFSSWALLPCRSARPGGVFACGAGTVLGYILSRAENMAVFHVHRTLPSNSGFQKFCARCRQDLM